MLRHRVDPNHRQRVFALGLQMCVYLFFTLDRTVFIVLHAKMNEIGRKHTLHVSDYSFRIQFM